MESAKAGSARSEINRSSTSYRQAIQDAMAVLNGQWVPAVLASLAARPLKYSDLYADINNVEERLGWMSHPRPISQKVLSATLRRMRRDGLISRLSSGSKFTEVYYELSPLGKTLLRALRPLAKWAMENGEEVARARAEADEVSGDV
jgi:DNA-binding HxlR family transcriptional regulator